MVNMTGGEAIRAMQAQAVIDGSVAQIVVPFASQVGPCGSEIEALAEEYAVVSVHTRTSDAMTVLTGPSMALERLGLAQLTDQGNTGSWPVWVAPAVGSQMEIHEGTQNCVESEFYIVASWQDERVSLDSLNNTLAGLGAPAWTARSVGESWIVGTAIAKTQNRWLEFLGVLGLGMLLVGLWAGYANELVRAGRSVAPIQALAPRFSFTRSVLAWRIIAPVAMSIGASLMIGLSLALMLENASRSGSLGGLNELPYGFVGVSCGIVAMTGLAAWVISSAAVSAASHRFRLGNPDE
jgi:hypothetical protein